MAAPKKPKAPKKKATVKPALRSLVPAPARGKYRVNALGNTDGDYNINGPRKKTRGNGAGLFGGVGPNAYVNQIFAPQEKMLADQQAARQAGLKDMVGQFLESLKGVSGELAPYTNAATQQTSDAANAARSLLAANPNAVTQADLAAVNAPQAQRDAVAGQNQAVFGGNAALLNYAGGAVPADQFRQDAAGRAAFLSALPAIGESMGVRGLNQIGFHGSQDALKLASDKANALFQARGQLADYVQKNQAAKALAAKTAFDQGLATAKYRTGVDQFNVRTTLQYKQLNLSARKFAQSTLSQDRNYGIALARLGISEKSLQIRLTAQEYKLQNGGFTNVQVNRFNTDAEFVAGQTTSAKTPPSLAVAMQEMYKRHVPLSIAQDALRKTGLYTIPTGAQLQSYNQTVGVGQKATPFDVVNFASSYIGIPYSWGGGTPKGPTKGFAQGANTVGFDCSSFVQAVMARVGVSLPRTTQAQVKQGQPVSVDQLQPGDLIFTRPGKNGPNHVGLYIGNGKVQESPHTGASNRIVSLPSYLSGGFVAARRVIGG